MMLWRLKDAQNALFQASLEGCDGSVVFDRIVIDSRAVQPGDLFVALKGERFDAHDFLEDVVRAGASALLVSSFPVGFYTPALIVPDTKLALGELAMAWRRRFTMPIVAVTGSNGKTTVKEMVAAIFAQVVGEDASLSTIGNFNNYIGLPLTVLRLREFHRFSVLEIGMNHPGETAYLANIAQPTIALINNAHREHQEFMLNVEAVAREHAAVLAALPQDGVAVFPNDMIFTPLWREIAGNRQVIDFAMDAAASVSGCYDSVTRNLHVMTPVGDFSLTLPVLGVHNARNALAAIACVLGAKIDDIGAIVRGLEQFKPVNGRMQVSTIEYGSLVGTTVIDDTYNANPDSIMAAINVLAQMRAPRILVLGDMGEVGDIGPKVHGEVGAYASEHGIEYLFGIGQATRITCQTFGSGSEHFEDVESLVSTLKAYVKGPATVLVKGSRFMKMERVLELLN
ncbi:UDP-N-acetylmuramoyl-tripeptide--D-alanyl-D-alanine ligase [Candidatus Pandoraea novymonadis]|uniref:UDP-N-acetylmuramoyl-tripeptide--D-alanyl-D-alanine ligase n=1 Tax=Candidatus Pandoraea novymonadis TaxID=1808959 RepID=A0ABX5FFF5_9BURK|nr:UDP-N-acetylmuramoyl-tripeptide--D-alanyl-D-alanine ligase [Candidatus Pandoraea novymonadis]PSB92399.1 UDP-N-acetylmuramoyl-tripeptide--D-alanyl-D-alanine ligase [Candidatus Pandoraea novymonadis]